MNNLVEKWKDGYLFIFVGGVFLYLQTAINLLANPDAIWNGLFYKTEYSGENGLGRWGLRYLAKLKGYTINPTLVTIFSIFVLSLIVMLLCRMFDINDAFYTLLIGIVVIASPNIANTLTYYYCSDFYIVAYFLMVLSIYYVWRKDGIVSYMLPAVMIMISLSLYQAYIGVAMLLSLMVLLISLLDHQKKVADILKLALKLGAVGGGGVILYLLSTKIMQKIQGFALTEGRGFSKMGKIEFAQLPMQLAQCYQNFFDYFFKCTLINNRWLGRRYINLFIFLSFFVFLFILLKQNEIYKEKSRIAMISVTILLSPVACLIMNIVAPEVSIHSSTGILIIPAMNYIYVIWIMMAVKVIRGNIKFLWVKKWSVRVLGACLAWILILFVSVFPNCMMIGLQKTCAVAREIAYDVDRIENYENYELVIGGLVDLGNEKLYDIVKGTVATYGAVWDTNGRNGCWDGIFRYYCNKDYQFCDYEEYLEIVDSDQYRKMALYPEQGSLAVTDKYIIVKLSE